MKRSSSHLRLGALVAVLAASFQPVSLPEVQVPDRSPPLFKPMEAVVVDRRAHRLGKKKKDKFHDRHAYRKQKHVGRAPNPRFK